MQLNQSQNFYNLNNGGAQASNPPARDCLKNQLSDIVSQYLEAKEKKEI
jgi:hypothetical protein